MTTVRSTTATNSRPPNEEFEYVVDLDDIARIHVGEITHYQHPRKTREGTTIDRSRKRELRRHLVRKSL